MSGAQTSTFTDPNILLRTLSGQQGLTNQLLQAQGQAEQQTVNANEIEQISRAANWVIAGDPENKDPAGQAQRYSTAVRLLQANNYAKNAPSEYPGFNAMQGYARMGTPSQTQAEWNANIAANKAYSNATAPPASAAAPGGGGDGSTAPAAAPNAGGATIGQRQNNPGNLSFAGQPYASPGQGNRFASFPDMATGVAANADQLALYQTQHGINTVRDAVTRWVGDPKADLTSYIGDISKALGVGPDDKIDLTDPAVQQKFIQAQFPHESAGGGYVLNPADVQKGVQMAAARRGRQVQPTPQVATVAPGGGATPPPYRVAQAGPLTTPPPAASTVPLVSAPSAAAAAAQPTTTIDPETQLPVLSAPQNQVMPGQPNGPPAAAPSAPTAVAAAPPGPAAAPPAAQPPPVRAAPAGGPQPPQLTPLNARGLTAQQQADINYAASTGRLTIQDRIKTEQGLAQQNIATQQKAFGDWIQLQQLQTSQGQLSVSQANSALEYWKAANPEAKVTLSGGEIITQDPRSGREISPRIKVTPNEAPRFHEGAAVWDNGQWRQPNPGEQGVAGAWAVGATGEKFYPAATRPAGGSYDQQQADYREDRKLLPEIAAQGEHAQTAQVRLQTMLDLLPKISTGAGGYTRTQLANLAETAGFDGIARALIAHSSDGDAAAAQEFGKLTLAAAGAAERGDLGSRGSLGALKLYQQNNPGLDLRPGANKAMLGMQLIAAQADTDYSQGALAWAKEHGTNFRNNTGNYKPLTEFDLQWQQQRNPTVYAAAMGALNGQDGAVWSRGLSGAEKQRALDIVSRASPSAVVNDPDTPGKKLSMQPNKAQPSAPAVGTIQGGYRFKGGDPSSQSSWERVQ